MKTAKVFLSLVVLACMVTSCTETDYRYAVAGLLDNNAVKMAQIMTTHIEDTGIEVKAVELAPVDFGGYYAEINASENWVKPYFTFISEDLSAYPNAPTEINGIIMTKMKSKDKVEFEFNITIDEPQGTCADVQIEIYEATLSLLSPSEREKYLTSGKQLSFIQDDRPGVNPVQNGAQWLATDPATMITSDGDDYTYEPMSTYVSQYDPIFQEGGGDENFRGVRYCKFLAHQAILSWMLTKSFEDDPVLITEKEFDCTEPGSFIPIAGSCLFYFPLAGYYYCSDYTGWGFDSESAQERCARRNGGQSVYSTVSCSERADEIEDFIPEEIYTGHTGRCAVHCQEEEEFIWNIYQDDPESSCPEDQGFYLFYPYEGSPFEVSCGGFD